jgi:hypothetical protein
MTNETKKQAAAREAREDEANQASQDAEEFEDVQIREEEMKHERDEETGSKDFEVGDAVSIDVDGVKVSGTVVSIQIKAKLVDVRIHEPGHKSHCLIVARPPEQVELAKAGKAQSA